MKIRMGKFDPETGTVPVSFSEGDNRHTRPVRAVLTDGEYDASATRLRAEEVGAGVVHKWSLGLLGPEPTPETAPE
ncbi:hypothetical protein [Novosphingobium sp.]|uniref:hypothetical protein n=1 Tax=Novosphingobium sp. TaxID=1874826 RepID=UPI0038BD8868